MLAAPRIGGMEPNEFEALGRSYPELVNQSNFLGLSVANIITLAKRDEPGTFKIHILCRISMAKFKFRFLLFT